MNSDDKDDENALDEDSFFDDDYDEESPFDDELEFEEENFDLAPDLELEDEEDYDHTLELDREDEPSQETDNDEQWHEDGMESQDDEYSQPWPLGLFAAGIIALLLLAAGGYGVLEQRQEMQKEVRQLRAKLATTTSNTEVAENRQAQRNLQIHNEDLQAQVERLQAEMTDLREELTRAKSEAPAHPAITVSPEATPVAVKPATAPPKAPPTTVEGAWFVNFGSYKSKATADSWASRLSVNAGRVAVIPGEKKGTLYYRVRVLDLPNKEIAGKIALQLEQTHHLSRLWVGKQ
jgi:cell division septation protein DedD